MDSKNGQLARRFFYALALLLGLVFLVTSKAENIAVWIALGIVFLLLYE